MKEKVKVSIDDVIKEIEDALASEASTETDSCGLGYLLTDRSVSAPMPNYSLLRDPMTTDNIYCREMVPMPIDSTDPMFERVWDLLRMSFRKSPRALALVDEIEARERAARDDD